MIKHAQPQDSKRVKAVGLISGGLDSALAGELLSRQEIDVHGVYFAMPWGCGSLERAQKVCGQIGIPLKVIKMGEDYIEMLRSPRYGYGRAFNPCVDCHIHMVRKAAEYMTKINARFVFTGEILGQRPMSQRRDCLRWVEKGTELDGLLLRPLCALLLPETKAEAKGWVDRSRLLRISGRGRKEQFDLAARWGISHYSAPGGGCLLTERHFSARIKDVLNQGYRDLRDVAILKYGRYFRIDKDHIVLVGRDEEENEYLVHNVHSQDVILRLKDYGGPYAVLKGQKISEPAISLAAGLVRWFSKYRSKSPLSVIFWPAADARRTKVIQAPEVTPETMKAMSV